MTATAVLLERFPDDDGRKTWDRTGRKLLPVDETAGSGTGINCCRTSSARCISRNHPLALGRFGLTAKPKPAGYVIFQKLQKP